MAIPEREHHDLYTALVDSIGEQPAGTLMAALPTYDPTEVLTKADLQLHLAPIHTSIEGLRGDVKRLFDGLRDINGRLDAVNGRLDAINDRFDAMNGRLDNWWKALLAAVVTLAAAVVASNAIG